MNSLNLSKEILINLKVLLLLIRNVHQTISSGSDTLSWCLHRESKGFFPLPI